jgi:hypothetical protein
MMRKGRGGVFISQRCAGHSDIRISEAQQLQLKRNPSCCQSKLVHAVE